MIIFAISHACKSAFSEYFEPSRGTKIFMYSDFLTEYSTDCVYLTKLLEIECGFVFINFVILSKHDVHRCNLSIFFIFPFFRHMWHIHSAKSYPNFLISRRISSSSLSNFPFSVRAIESEHSLRSMKNSLSFNDVR